jgi:hypothetical protein
MAEDEKHAGGRPLAYDSPEKLSKAISDYFDGTKRPTLSGLAVALGIDRSTLYNYANRDQFFDIIKNAQAKVESIYEERLVWDNCTGVIFPLKNMGWKDKTEQELSGALAIQQITGMTFKD